MVKRACAVFLLVLTGCSLRAKNLQPDRPFDFVQLNRLAQYAQAAYNEDATIRSVCRPDYHDVVIKVVASTNNKYFFATSTVTQTQLLVIAGTSNLENVLLDADFNQDYSRELNIPLHRGFAKAARLIYDDIKPRVRPGYTLWITGHSLGGAEGVIVGMLLQAAGLPPHAIVTFGQPKVTVQSGVELFKKLPLTRVVNQRDLIPAVPLEPYRLNGPELVLFPGTQYSLVDQRPLDPRALAALWQALRSHQPPAELEHHYIATYRLNLSSKTHTSELIQYP